LIANGKTKEFPLDFFMKAILIYYTRSKQFEIYHTSKGLYRSKHNTELCRHTAVPLAALEHTVPMLEQSINNHIYLETVTHKQATTN
jgi:hypothetical protein